MSKQDEASSARPAPPFLQTAALTLLRVAVGWHFLYEGVVKVLNPEWSAAPYLRSATGPLAEFFQDLAADSTALAVVNTVNIAALVLVGGALMLGFFTRLSALAGIALLALYYLAHPPFTGTGPGTGLEGHYLFVDKNLVELIGLGAILVARGSSRWGLDRLVAGLWARGKAAAEPSEEELEAAVERDPLGRRAVLASLTGIPFLGAFVYAVLREHGWASHEEAQLAARAGTASGTDGVTTATIKTFQFTTLDQLKGQVPHASIKDLEVSRLILGGNLIGGWAHARDLIYVSKLVKAYHHKWKVFETFALAEKCGINAFLTNPVLCETINEYWKRGIGDIQFISDCGGRDVLKMVQKSIDHGAAACYIQGATGDRLVRQKKFDLIAKALKLIRDNDLPAGIGGHRLATITACVEHDLLPDFWMKTLHHHNYWSAKPEQRCDNLWCEQPEETIAFMADRPEPWIAFKTLAAGAIHPKVGFPYAFKGGADFLCVGMYDFQIVDDVNIALAALADHKDRPRPWHG
ncbi:MAG: DoxX family protein [bacterium]